MENNQEIIDKNSELFDQYLVEFQQDIRRIVGKFKKNFHALSDEEIYSECNLHLLKNKEKILKTFSKDQQFDQSEFKKIAYHYVKNEAVWTHYRFINKSYNRRKLDAFTETEEGTKTVFEAAIENQGKENEEIDNDKAYFESNSKQFLHILTKYCYLLTEMECKLLSYLHKGLSQEQIANKLKVTHQAISAGFVGMQQKLNNFFNTEEVFAGGHSSSITKGQESMNNFFDKGLDDPAITSFHRKKIKDFILKNPYLYSGKQINKILFDDKYSLPKVNGAIKSLKLTPLVISKSRPVADAVKDKMLNYFCQKKTIKMVSQLVNLPINTVRRIRSQFVIEGKLKNLKER